MKSGPEVIENDPISNSMALRPPKSIWDKVENIEGPSEENFVKLRLKGPKLKISDLARKNIKTFEKWKKTLRNQLKEPEIIDDIIYHSLN